MSPSIAQPIGHVPVFQELLPKNSEKLFRTTCCQLKKLQQNFPKHFTLLFLSYFMVLYSYIYSNPDILLVTKSMSNIL